MFSEFVRKGVCVVSNRSLHSKGRRITTKDVVCGMTVNEQHAMDKGLTAQHGGNTYYFCSKNCRKKFNQNPQQFTGTQTPQGQKVS